MNPLVIAVDLAWPRGAAMATRLYLEQHRLHHSLWHSGVGAGSSKVLERTEAVKPKTNSEVS